MAQKISITLDVTGPDGVTTSTSSDQESIIIGSGAAAALQVIDPLVSSLHCMIKLEQGRVAVIDLGSSSGTRVKDRTIREPVALESGETIALGASKIRVTFAASSGQAPPLRVMDPPVEPQQEPRGAGRIESPTERDKVLQVTLRWGSTLLETRLLPEGTWLTIGEGPECDISILEVGPRLDLARATGSTLTVQLPPSSELQVSSLGEEPRAGQVLRSQGRLIASPKGETIELGLRERAVVGIGALSIGLGFVRPPPQALAVPLRERDFTFFKIVCICLLTFFALVGAIAVTPLSEGGDGDDLFANPARYVNLLVKPETKQAPSKFKELAQARDRQRARDHEGKFGKQDGDHQEKDPSRPGAPLVDATKHEEDRKKVSLLMAGMFGGGSSSNVFGPGGLGTGINNALGGLKGGSGAGDSHGLGGLGARGAGSGGGGSGLGLGGLGTRGGGAGGSGSIDLGGRGKDTHRIIPGKTTIVGGLDRDVIMKVIKRHQNEIKFCYEAELQTHPELAGKVAVAWTIDPRGMVADASVSESSMGNPNVESCILERIRRWKFPEPEGGGVVAVTFPWIFKVAGDDGE